MSQRSRRFSLRDRTLSFPTLITNFIEVNKVAYMRAIFCAHFLNVLLLQFTLTVFYFKKMGES